jgi:signal transduction histidine kinase
VLITLAIVLFVSFYLTTTIEIASRRRRSEVARHSAELEEAREQVRQADKMTALGQLAANMAHDINNPAGVICTRLEVMEAEGAFDNLPDRLQRDLAILREHAQYLRRVAQNWTDFARKRSLHIGRIDLNEAVRRTVAMVADSLEPRRIALDMDLRETPTFIGGDLVGLQQVILNLVNNACDAMPRGGTLRIHTGVTLGPDRSPHALLEVEDTGTGIAPEDLERIFEPFFSRKPKGQGTGLGLTISRQIVKEMNGEIRVRSRPGEGTVFTIEFPADSTGERAATHAVG